MENIPCNAECIISKDKTLLQPAKIVSMLAKNYWAKNRPTAVTLKAIENSVCYGVYISQLQVGFARVITDYATSFYLCDVIIDEEYRGQGLGKQLVNVIVNDPDFKPLIGILATDDAHGLYEQYGFVRNSENFMRHSPGA